MENWLFLHVEQDIYVGFCHVIKGCWVIFEYVCKMSLMEWFLLNRLQINLEPRKISLEQKYLAFYNPYDPSYLSLDQHRNLKKLTFPSVYSVPFNHDELRLPYMCFSGMVWILWRPQCNHFICYPKQFLCCRIIFDGRHALCWKGHTVCVGSIWLQW